MPNKLLIALAALIFVSWANATEVSPVFRFHLVTEPASLRPWDQKNSSSGYLLSQVTGTLLLYQDRLLQPNLAESCQALSSTKIQCRLRPDLKWSDGSPLRAEDFVRSFQEFLDPKNHAFRADLLFPVKNAKRIFKGELPKESLGFKIKKKTVLEIQLEYPDSEFLYTLTSPLLAPLPPEPFPSLNEIQKKPSLHKSSGAYQISSWESLKKIHLIPNPHFWKKSQDRPALSMVTVAEDSVALNLYEKGELTFLRRLPTLFVPKYKGKPELFEIDQFRFDYLGFSEKWKKKPQLRKALAQSLNFSELQSLFFAKNPLGCPGFSPTLHHETICHEPQVSAAQTLWKNTLEEKPKRIELFYSKQGGDDHKRMMEWFQSEWKKNLGIDVEVSSLENKVFIEKIEKNPPDIFRKGIAPDRPTCLSALETFESGNSENYLRFSDPQFDSILKQMRTSMDTKKKKILCDQGLHLLMDSAYLIPTGSIHFSMLASTEWTGWKLNELNQLDLTDLKPKKTSTNK